MIAGPLGTDTFPHLITTTFLQFFVFYGEETFEEKGREKTELSLIGDVFYEAGSRKETGQKCCKRENKQDDPVGSGQR